MAGGARDEVAARRARPRPNDETPAQRSLPGSGQRLQGGDDVSDPTRPTTPGPTTPTVGAGADELPPPHERWEAEVAALLPALHTAHRVVATLESIVHELATRPPTAGAGPTPPPR